MTHSSQIAERTLYTQGELFKRIQDVAKRIAEDYKDKRLSFFDNPLVLVCVLKGSFMFFSDLLRALADHGVPVRPEFICVSSYGGDVVSSGQVRMLLDTRQSVEGKHVMFVEDIIDTATTMKYLHDAFKTRAPASLKTTVLLDKPEGRKEVFDADYVVANVPNVFVVGYGLDYDDAFRELRDVVVLNPDVYKRREEMKRNQTASRSLNDSASELMGKL